MNKRADAFIHKDKSYKYAALVDNESSIFYKHTRTDVYVAAVSVGYYNRQSERIPTSSKQNLFVSTTLGENRDDNLWIMRSIAIATRGIEILSNIREIFSICDEFANCGIDILYNFHVNSDDEVNEMAAILMDILEEFRII